MAEVRPGVRLDALGRPMSDDQPEPHRPTDALGRPLTGDGPGGAVPGVGQDEAGTGTPTASLPTTASGEAVLIAHSSGVNSAPLGQVRMDIDALRTFANRDLQSIHSDAQELLHRFNDLPVHATMFSGAVLPMELAHQLVVVHDILGAGLRGVAADIDRFGDNLRKSADNQQRADDNAAEALQRAARKFGEGGSEAQRAFDTTAAQRRGAAPVAPSAPPVQPAASPPAGSGGDGSGGASF